MRRVVFLPNRGRLIVATDLQGNLSDFERVAAVFEEATKDKDGAILVITGDLVHGPEIDEADWPEYLGSFYRGDSAGVLRQARALMDRFPGRVHYLLGNHEHAHVGGPIVAKFFPDEAQRLEELLGEEETYKVRAWLKTWPFVAVAPTAGILMLHAAPHVKINGVDDLERFPLEGSTLDMPLEEMAMRGSLGALLWARTTSSERAHAFMRAVYPGARVAVFGHDVARAGYAIDREPMLCLSTSFGCFDGDKLYLEWDLARPAESAAHVARLGLRPLHPTALPIFRQP